MKSLFFLYHELREEQSQYSYALHTQSFDQHCATFSNVGKESSEMLQPEITFDDGYKSDYQLALPILQKHGLTARFFITAGWTGERSAYLTLQELRGLAAQGQSIGAHGWSHKLLTHCSDSELDRELRGAKLRLEDSLGKVIDSMSLPGGRYNTRVLRACREAGYLHVFTSVPRAEDTDDGSPVAFTPGRLNVRSDATPQWMEQVLDPVSNTLTRMERLSSVKSTAQAVLGDKLYAWLWAAMNRAKPDSEASNA